MLILIDNKSGAPIYDQIFTQIPCNIFGTDYILCPHLA